MPEPQTVQDQDAMVDQPIALKRAFVERYLLASLAWSAVRWDEYPMLLERGVLCLRALIGKFYDQGRRGFTHLPLFVFMDMLAIVELGDRTPFASEGRSHLWDPTVRRARLDYENILLATLLQEPAFVDARERLSGSGHIRQAAAERLVELLLQSFAQYYPSWVHLDPAHIRDIALPDVGDIHPDQAQKRLDEVVDASLFLDGLKAMLKGISDHVYWRDLLKEEDLFEIENWAVLDTEAKRIGSRQIAEVDRRLSEFRLPRVSLRDEIMEVDTDLDDDTVYPTGGFSGLTTRGSFENLVRSELVYMDAGAVDGVSLFDLRFAENELLFYLRNDGIMRRRRRTVHVVLDIEDIFHAKSPGYDYPFSTLTQGLIVRLVRDLIGTFEEDAVEIHIHYVHAPSSDLSPDQAHATRALLQRERDLLELVLNREIRQELVHVHDTPDIDVELFEQAKGRVYVVAMAFSEKSDTFWRGLFDDLSQAKPMFTGLTLPIGLSRGPESIYEEEVPLILPLNEASFVQVAEIKNELFAALLGARR